MWSQLEQWLRWPIWSSATVYRCPHQLQMTSAIQTSMRDFQNCSGREHRTAANEKGSPENAILTILLGPGKP
jgi:hypothetical protein